MKEIEINTNKYRVREMNAIELFALRSQGDLSSFDTAVKSFKTMLENLEVEVLGKWLPVKEKNMEVYYPKGIENDFETISKLMEFLSEYLSEVFTKSNESKKETE